MRKLTIIFAAIILMFASQEAKSQKLASMDYQQVLAVMPEIKTMSTTLDTFTKAKDDELNKQYDAFQAQVKEYQTNGPKLAKTAQLIKEKELQKTQESLEQLKITAQKDVSDKRDVMLKPILEKVNAAVTKVAKANGYDFIFDKSAFVYKVGEDATAAVKKELGL